MDLSFGRGQPGLAAAPVELDFPQLIAIVASAQAASRTAQLEAVLSRRGEAAREPVEALIELFDPRGSLRAASLLGGSFSPETASMRRKD